MTRQTGIPSITAATPLQKSFAAGIQPAPSGIARAGPPPSRLGVTDSDPTVIGDHGRIKAPAARNAGSYRVRRVRSPEPGRVRFTRWRACPAIDGMALEGEMRCGVAAAEYAAFTSLQCADQILSCPLLLPVDLRSNCVYKVAAT